MYKVGGRYFILGTQIGMLLAMIGTEHFKDALKLLNKIEEEQYICQAEDFKKLLKKLKE